MDTTVPTTTDLVIGMAGAGGDGVISAGDARISAAARDGYFAIMTKSFGSQIRGGESSFRLRLSVEPLFNAAGTLDIAIALNWEDFLRFGAELPVDGRTTVIYEAATKTADDRVPLPIRPFEAIGVPIGAMAREAAGTDLAKNTVVLGLIAGWLGLPHESLVGGLRKRFAKKSAEVLEDPLGAN